jgi:hypothetical protein
MSRSIEDDRRRSLRSLVAGANDIEAAIAEK